MTTPTPGVRAMSESNMENKTVAHCERCGREFLTLPQGERVDHYFPISSAMFRTFQRRRLYQPEMADECGGTLIDGPPKVEPKP